MKKEAVGEDTNVAPSVPKAGGLNFANRETISFYLGSEANSARISILNVKGAVVWQKNLGNLPAGINNVGWSGLGLPSGSYHAKLETGSVVLVNKFELR